MSSSSRVTAKEHTKSAHIRHEVNKFVGCPVLTSNGSACRPSMATNKFKDSATGRKWDCNWYCLRKCTPDRLRPLFNNLPSEVISEEGNRFIITNIVITFKVEHSFRKLELEYDTKSWDPDHPEVVVCSWIQSLPSNSEVVVEAFVSIDEGELPQLSHEGFSSFDRPFLRPTGDWQSNIDVDQDDGIYGMISTSFALDNSD